MPSSGMFMVVTSSPQVSPKKSFDTSTTHRLFVKILHEKGHETRVLLLEDRRAKRTREHFVTGNLHGKPQIPATVSHKRANKQTQNVAVSLSAQQVFFLDMSRSGWYSFRFSGFRQGEEVGSTGYLLGCVSIWCSYRFSIFTVLSVELDWPVATSVGCTRGGARSYHPRSVVGALRQRQML